MQEHEVTVAGNTYKLDPPFFVMATQNPIEQEGTYPLPEAQLDRFMLSINIGYPTRDEEREIVMATTQTTRQEVRPVLQGQDILWIQKLVRQVPTSQHVVDYAVDLARATRPKEPPSPDFVKNWLAWGAGPRAAQYMILGAKARAILHGRFAVEADDVRAMAYPVLRHRLFTNFNADAEGIDVDQVIEKLLETVPEPTYGEKLPAKPRQPSRPQPAAPPRTGRIAASGRFSAAGDVIDGITWIRRPPTIAYHRANAFDPLDRFENIQEAFSIASHSGIASCSTRFRIRARSPFSVTTSTRQPSALQLFQKSPKIEEARPGCKSTSTSTSLSDVASPRATEPKTRTFDAPCRAARMQNILSLRPQESREIPSIQHFLSARDYCTQPKRGNPVAELRQTAFRCGRLISGGDCVSSASSCFGLKRFERNVSNTRAISTAVRNDAPQALALAEPGERGGEIVGILGDNQRSRRRVALQAPAGSISAGSASSGSKFTE